MRPPAVVMNMFYTGLGIARSLGEQGIPVVGLTTRRRMYGNFTRHAKVVLAPDSRNEPEALLAFLLKRAESHAFRPVIFPTRDDDVLFLDRFRRQLEPYYALVAPDTYALNASLDKWQTFSCATEAGVAVPKCWLIDDEDDLYRVRGELTYPCVLKPAAAHHWRQGKNWELVRARKAIGISSWAALLSEYKAVALANSQVLLQEQVPGGDDALFVVACYLDRSSNCAASFNAQKLAQMPETFGTGFIVQTVDRPELLDRTMRLLKMMRFTGIAEVEYKWDSAEEEYKLIEVNPRPWDQHRLGKRCGTDLIYRAYCEHAGEPMPPITSRRTIGDKWIAEETFVATALGLLRRRDPRLRALFQLARGKRIYAIGSANDPLPLIAFVLLEFIPGLIRNGLRSAWSGIQRMVLRKLPRAKEGCIG